ncbi:flavin reductase family protein [Cryobacterium sp. 10C2]|nr:flavin reductase family protein [Cryobacterium sp. 10C2]MDY7526596.1 flavin reductase family protein [Cryobacterium sp. 10C2]MEB0291305.1 flavin reductase family protein [Cryobacterium sp. 10C2]
MNDTLATGGGKGAISLAEYKVLFGNHPGGVAVITVGGVRPAGFTATSVISVSAQPPLLVFSINKTSSSWPIVAEATSAVVHFLSNADRAVADRFATSGIDRFAGLEYSVLDTGEPLIAGIETWAQGTLINRVEVGSSVLLVLQIETAAAAVNHHPLVYRARNYYHLADESKLV